MKLRRDITRAIREVLESRQPREPSARRSVRRVAGDLAAVLSKRQSDEVE